MTTVCAVVIFLFSRILLKSFAQECNGCVSIAAHTDPDE